MPVGKHALWPQNQLNHHHALHNHIFPLLHRILVNHEIIMLKITYSKESTLYLVLTINVIIIFFYIKAVAQKYTER